MRDVALRLRQRKPADPARGFVPADHYDIVVGDDVVGEIVLRLGDTEHLRLYGGQVGYRVAPEFRGHSYGAAALSALKTHAIAAGFEELWITCAPENIASRKTLDRAGAAFVEILDLPETTDLYARGERRACRYRMILTESISRSA